MSILFFLVLLALSKAKEIENILYRGKDCIKISPPALQLEEEKSNSLTTTEEVRGKVKAVLDIFHTELAKQKTLSDIISYWNNPRHEHAQVLTEPCLASLCIKYLMELANKLLHLPEADEVDSYVMHCATMSYVTSFFLMQCMVRNSMI